jgi:hypothetical protein
VRAATSILRVLLAPLVAIGLAAGVVAEEGREGADFSDADLSGDWYVLIHYKDDRSEDKSIVKFKDFAWSIEQRDKTMTWEHYPYVVFDDETELVRRAAMTKHKNWEPDDGLWAKIRKSLEVSSRAADRKRLTGSTGEGFKSLAPITTGGLNTMSFTRNWDVSFHPENVRIVITDALSGGAGLSGMEESILYEIREKVSQDEYRGFWDGNTKRGQFRMVRSAERKVVK